ncbi:MAG: 16S rRNA (cytosine(1402)-N(4))-methyltransferase RsmH [Armatimonadetes bacterium]|nr:16S rRNA (cytosine(1402)-N(4))-methyltransferase RsmH [Armatimonadota bacterium]
MHEQVHLSAMVPEVLAELDARPGGYWVDSTVDGGGHAKALAEAIAPDGQLLGIDMDSAALELARRVLAEFAERVVLMHERFSRIDQAVQQVWPGQRVDGVLADLGPSRHQLVSPDRGFSFASDARLDARYDRSQDLTAWQVVNGYSRDELVRVLTMTGKPRQARKVAEAIVARRRREPIETVSELADVIRRAVGRRKRGRADASTEYLMAIRFEVNDELREAAEGIEAATRALKPGGRLVVLSWDGTTHGLVRRKLRSLARGCICPPGMPCTCGRVPLLRLREGKGRLATEAEQKRNPATRTCRLFSAERLPSKEDG